MQETHDFQVKILQLAEAEGVDLSRASRAQYTRLALKVRSTQQQIQAGARAITSRIKTSIGYRTVSLQVSSSNESICRQNTCGKFRLLGDEPACDSCGCSGKFLRSKWKDGDAKCPLPNPLWDNTVLESTVTPNAGGDTRRVA